LPDYRCYPIQLSGSIGGPAQIIDCVDDDDAITKAHAMFYEQSFEVWLGARKIYPAE
jgi:hypothetical protein